jgi:multidrug efflux system membrane fusion protein
MQEYLSRPYEIQVTDNADNKECHVSSFSSPAVRMSGAPPDHPNPSQSDDHGVPPAQRAALTSAAPTPVIPAGPPKRHHWRLWIVLVVLVLVGIALWLGIRAWMKPKPAKAPPPVPVVAVVAQSGDIPVYLTGIGNVQAYNNVTLRTHVDGTLDKVNFVEGQSVKAGDVLAQIDPRPFKAQLEQVVAAKARDEALLANARVDLKRFQTLQTQDSIAIQQVDTQRALVAQDAATVQNDQAQIDYARVQLNYTTITSPISGRTGIRLVDAGNIVHATDTTGIVTVTQIEPISLVFTLPEDQLAQVTKRMATGKLAVSAYLRGDGKPAGEGELLVVNNQVDQTTGSVQLKATFPNKDHALWPGQFADARLLIETRHDAVTVPPAAIQRGPQGLFSYVVAADGTAQMRAVKVSTANVGSGLVLVDSGIVAGERVIVDGQLKLHAGSKVKLVQAGDTSQPAAPAKTAASANSAASASASASASAP